MKNSPKSIKTVVGWLIFFSYNVTFAQEPQLVLPVGHTSIVNTVNFSPNGKLIVTASDDNTVKIWDAQNGTLIIDLKGYTRPVVDASFSPDSKKILTASGDTVKIWDAINGALLSVLNGHTRDIAKAVFSPDGKKVVTASVDYTAKIWDVVSGARLANLKHTGSVNSAVFSPDGKKIVTASLDSSAKIWDAVSGALLADLQGHASWLNSACFSPDGKKVVTSSVDGTARIWDAMSGTLLIDLQGHHSVVNSACFSSDNEKVVTTSDDKTARIWNATNGALIAELKGFRTPVKSACFSPDGKTIITISNERSAKIWDATSGALLDSLKGHIRSITSVCFSPEGTRIATTSMDKTTKIWDAQNGDLLIDLKGRTHEIKSARFSPDNSKQVIVTASWDGTAKIWDAKSGDIINLQGHTSKVNTAYFSPDGQKIVTASWDSTAKVWDAQTGKMLVDLKGYTNGFTSASFSPDGKKIVTTSRDGTATIWDAESGTHACDLRGHTKVVSNAYFSPDGKKIITASWDSTAKIWDVQTGALLLDLKEHTNVVYNACFSPDGKKIVTASWDNTAKIWDSQSGALLATLKGHTNKVNSASFSPDGKIIITASRDKTVKIWDAESGLLLGSLEGHQNWVNTAYFSGDGKKIVTASEDNSAKIWDADTRTLLYTFFVVDSSDYLVVDKDNHYDGTPAARKLLYYKCGREVIELQQLKDRLWVPDLAERINGKDTIKAPALSDLDICGLTPLVDQIESKTGYQFKITPRKGGLGETVLFVNGIETGTFQPQVLKKVAGGYELFVKKGRLEQYFVAGKENTVSVKAYTKENDISSRGVIVLGNTISNDTTPPNLYAVVIGVSDYKSKELHLQYAAKDAVDFGNSVQLSASKLLGKEHVFVYSLNTGTERSGYPEKRNIKDVFREIGKQAKAKDVLMVFFAGHGVVEGEKKQFYFLTADASNSTLNKKDIKDVGISAAELMEWMKPATMKAQKRILILDACQSGALITDVVKFGKDQGYVVARNDDKTEEIKQIDKLNEKAGLYILAASASNQSAYEMGVYNQGLLTYSLLKAIKEHPEVLEQDKFLNISNWFNEAVKIVAGIVRKNNLAQEPQLITTTNFPIGLVDGEVLTNIKLPDEKPLFSGSNFQNNDGDVAYDNLRIGKAVDNRLNQVSARGSDAISCFGTDSPDAYIISGRYEVKENEITLKANLTQIGGKFPKYLFEVKGNKNDIPALVEKIAQKAMERAAVSK